MNRECLADNAPLKQTFEEMVRGVHVENYENNTKQTEQEVQRSKDRNMPGCNTWDILNDYSLIKSIYLIS